MRSPAGKQRGARPYRGHSAGGSTGLLAQGGGARRQVLGKGVPWPRGAPSAVKGGTAADRRCVPGAWGAAEMGGLCPWCGERAAWQKRASRGSRWGSSRLLAPASQRRAGVGGGDMVLWWGRDGSVSWVCLQGVGAGSNGKVCRRGRLGREAPCGWCLGCRPLPFEVWAPPRPWFMFSVRPATPSPWACHLRCQANVRFLAPWPLL